MQSHGEPTRVLVVEDDADLGEVLALVLREEGYEVSVAAELAEALAAVDEQSFDLIVTDLFASGPRDVLATVLPLRERATPTPLGVMTAWPLAEDEGAESGFAFILAKPFGAEQFLAEVASGVHAPLTPEQERQAQVVHRYFAALSESDWYGLAELCTEDVVYALPGTTSYAGEIVGREAFRRYSEETFRGFPGVRFDHVVISALPNGLTARYSGSWQSPDGEELRMSGAVVFHFEGERIQRVGVRLPDERFAALLGGQAG